MAKNSFACAVEETTVAYRPPGQRLARTAMAHRQWQRCDLPVMAQTGFPTHISPISPGHQRYLSQAARPRIIARDSGPADNRDHLLPLLRFEIPGET